LLKEQKGQVAKDALLGQLRDNEVQVQEVMKGGVEQQDTPAPGTMGDRITAELESKLDSAGTLTLAENRLLDWLNSHPDASDREVLVREYDIWLEDHAHHSHLDPDEALTQIRHAQEAGQNTPAMETERRFLEDWTNRYWEVERDQSGETHGEGATRYRSYALPAVRITANCC